MRNKGWLILAALLIALLPVGGVRAEGSPPGSSGAAVDDGSQPVLTPEQQQQLAQGEAAFAKFKQLWEQGLPENQIRAALGLPPRPGASPAAYPVADSVNMLLTGEPNSGYAVNWCGPASGEAVLSTFISIPPPGYATPLDYMTYLVGLMMHGTQTTTLPDWVSVVNGQINPAFYTVHYCTDVDDFKAKLVWDITYQRHPINNLINTLHMPGWGRHDCSHYVAANGYDIPDNPSATITYGDTGSQAATGGQGNPYGFWTVNLNDFYGWLPAANGNEATIMAQ